VKVGMIQSNYLPWRGYFDFIDDVDVFVFFDDVKYSHRTWRNRNLLKTSSGLLWLSVPVLHNSETLIQEARIDNTSRWAEKHIRSISLAYRKAPYFDDYAGELFALLAASEDTISDLNVKLCKWMMEKLSIETEIRMSSEFVAKGDKYQRPLEMLREMGATAYLSGPTAKPYTDNSAFRRAGISLEFKAYEYPEYPQLHGSFISNVSALDLLFNCGTDARLFLKSSAANEIAT
jgi:hypothetical protein